MLADPDQGAMQRAYARWAPIYDAVCGPIFANARRAATGAARRAGRRILEIGVGTGLSFGDYDANYEVTGIDVSEPMIARARMRLSTGRFPHVRALKVMDAHDLEFADCAFDCVVAQFLITLVAEPERVMDECARVLRPGGEIILVNHFYSETGLAAKLEDGLARHARSVGLRPEFPFQRLDDWAKRHGGIAVIERRRIAPFRVFTLVRFGKIDPPARASCGPSAAFSEVQQSGVRLSE